MLLCAEADWPKPAENPAAPASAMKLRRVTMNASLAASFAAAFFFPASMLDMYRRVQALMPREPGAIMTEHLLPTTVVGSYPQPDWLVDRALLRTMVPRVRVHELWRVQAPHLAQAQDDATLLAIRDMER